MVLPKFAKRFDLITDRARQLSDLLPSTNPTFDTDRPNASRISELEHLVPEIGKLLVRILTVGFPFLANGAAYPRVDSQVMEIIGTIGKGLLVWNCYSPHPRHAQVSPASKAPMFPFCRLEVTDILCL